MLRSVAPLALLLCCSCTKNSSGVGGEDGGALARGGGRGRAPSCTGRRRRCFGRSARDSRTAPIVEALPAAAARRYVVALGAGRQVALKLEEGGAFRCEVTCPGAADPSVIAGLGYRSAAGVVLPGIGRGPDQPLVVPIGSDGTLLFSAELIARGSLLSEPCR